VGIFDEFLPDGSEKTSLCRPVLAYMALSGSSKSTTADHRFALKISAPGSRPTHWIERARFASDDPVFVKDLAIGWRTAGWTRMNLYGYTVWERMQYSATRVSRL